MITVPVDKASIPNLNDLLDVTIVNPLEGNALTYDFASSEWINTFADHNLLSTLQGGQADQYFHLNTAQHADLGDLGALTAGSILFAHSDGSIAQDNANLFWNNTNKRLGIGTNSPSVPFEVNGQAKSTGYIGAYIRPASDSTTALQLQNSSGSAAFINLDTWNGRIGIFSTTPTARLHIDHNDGFGTMLKMNNIAGGTAWHFNSGNDGYFRFAQTGVIDVWSFAPSTGYFGLMTTTPRTALDMIGTFRITYADNSIYTDFSTDSNGDLTIAPTGDLIVIGTGAAGVDYTLAFNGETNDGIISWMEDEDCFLFDDDIVLNTNADYLVGGDRYAFRYISDQNYGLFFNSTSGLFEYTGAGGTTLLSIDAGDGSIISQGSGYFVDNLGVNIAPISGATIYTARTSTDATVSQQAVKGILSQSVATVQEISASQVVVYSTHTSGVIDSMSGCFGGAVIDSNSVVTSATGVYGVALGGNTSTAAVSVLSGVQGLVDVQNVAAAYAISLYGLAPQVGAGSIANAMTLYCTEPSSGTNNWAGMFEGDVQINSSKKLLVEGSLGTKGTTGLYSQAAGYLDLFASNNIRIGDSSAGAPTNYITISSTGNQSFVGSAGFYPRTLNQSSKPAAGTGATQLDTSEMCIWTDTDDSKCYFCYNHGGTIKKIELT